jgi:hypothetical protein
MNKPVFIITIDTEGDNIWSKPIDISTKNADYLQRFQDLCNKFDFYPVYLTNYEMAVSSNFVKFAKRQLEYGIAEIGMHLHAWNCPPIFKLTENDFEKLPYLIEYPEDIMKKKIEYMTFLLEDTFGINIVSHRAGRWAFNEIYANILIEYRYSVDCSVTPYISWKTHNGAFENRGGSEYLNFPDKPYFINPQNISDENGNSTLLEVPMTIVKTDNIFTESYRNFKNKLLKKPKKFKTSWLRPTGNNLNEMLSIVDCKLKDNSEYIEFMLHSSELMPGGSPNFKNDDDVEKLYSDLEILFKYISKHFVGSDLKTFYKKFKKKIK